MLKNILFQFNNLYNVTCVYCRVEDKLSLCITFPFEHVRPDLDFLYLLLPLKYHPTTLERQLNYLKWFATISLWQSYDLSAVLCHQSFLAQCLLSTYWKLFWFLESIWVFSMILNHRVFDKFIQFKSCVKSASHYFYCFNGFTNS